MKALAEPSLAERLVPLNPSYPFEPSLPPIEAPSLQVGQVNSRIGYCTNVHAGATLAQTRLQLAEHAVRVKNLVCPSGELPLGLWLSAETAAELRHRGGMEPFLDWMQENGLSTLTLNGFPYGDFHIPEVKHRVYLPTWWEPDRLDYTLDLIHLLPRLLGSRNKGCISTLPIAWGIPHPSEARLKEAAAQIVRACEEMEQVEAETGKHLLLALEPEPGCLLTTSDDLVQFFERYLLPAGPDDLVMRYAGVCHDVCHAVVMFESQADVLRRYAKAGIQIAKVQVSSGILCKLDELDATDRPVAMDQLRQCGEPRYLHQACHQKAPGEPVTFFQDLPEAMASSHALSLEGAWAVHFHVPVHVDRFGWLTGSQQAIAECLAALGADRASTDFEVETYAWNVLPKELAVKELSEGVAAELRWFQALIAAEAG